MLIWAKKRREWEAFISAAQAAMPPGFQVERVFVPSVEAGKIARVVRRARKRDRAALLQLAARVAVQLDRAVRRWAAGQGPSRLPV